MKLQSLVQKWTKLRATSLTNQISKTRVTAINQVTFIMKAAKAVV